MNFFNAILKNPPLFIFFLFVVLCFILFVVGVIIIFRAKGDHRKIEKGRKILLISFYGVFAILLSALVFQLTMALLNRGAKLKPPITPGAFPPSPAISNVPPPDFVKIGRYYFMSPQPFSNKFVIDFKTFYAILCKKDGDYDIIYIGDIGVSGSAVDLRENANYVCWLQNCPEPKKNLYIAFLQTPQGFGDKSRSTIREEIEKSVNPVCLEKGSEEKEELNE